MTNPLLVPTVLDAPPRALLTEADAGRIATAIGIRDRATESPPRPVTATSTLLNHYICPAEALAHTTSSNLGL